MTLRSVNPYTSYQMLLGLQRTKTQLATLSEQIASGERLTRLGDDPTASALVLNFQDSIQKNEAYSKQVDSASASLSATDTALQSAHDSITRLLEIATQGLGTTATSSSQAAVEEVNGIKDNLVSIANTKENGKYIFAGTKTTTQPFAATTTGASYSGNHDIINLDISASTDIQTNLAGDTVFFNGDATLPTTPTTGPGSGGDLFTQVTNLATALGANNKAGIQTAFNNLKAIQGNINARLSEVGGRAAALEQHSGNLESYNTTLESIQSSYKKLDYPAATADYAQAQLSEQAAYAMLSKVSSQNLFNFLA